MTGRAARGFTLLEVLVAITIFSLVIAVLYAGYRLGMRSWESGERTQAAVSELRLAGSFIRRHAAEAFPLAISESRAWRLWFQGEPERLVFITAMPAYLGQGGMYEMTLQVDDTEEGATLTVSRRLLHPDAETGRPGIDDRPRPLVEGLESATFDFFGTSAEEGVASWHRTWVDQQHLPQLVRLRLVSRRAGAWPDMVIHLPSDAVRYQRTVAPGGPGQSGQPQIQTPPESGSILAPGLTR
jgi:general secretion pathway protein J